jgi:hypothetical protein
MDTYITAQGVDVDTQTKTKILPPIVEASGTNVLLLFFFLRVARINLVISLQWSSFNHTWFIGL